MARFSKNFIKEKFKEGVWVTKKCDSPGKFFLKWWRWERIRFVQWANQEIIVLRRQRWPLWGEGGVGGGGRGGKRFLCRTKLVCLDSFLVPWVVKWFASRSGSRLWACWLAAHYKFWAHWMKSPGCANAVWLYIPLSKTISSPHSVCGGNLKFFSVVFSTMTLISVSYLSSFHSSGSLQTRSLHGRNRRNSIEEERNAAFLIFNVRVTVVPLVCITQWCVTTVAKDLHGKTVGTTLAYSLPSFPALSFFFLYTFYF